MKSVHKDLENRDYVIWREFLRSAEGWDSRRIRDYQILELARVAAYAYQNTDGYRERFDVAGFRPGKVASLEAVRDCPFTAKDDFRQNLEKFSVRRPDSYYVTTGGSSGVPMGMYRDGESFAKELASKAHQYERIGWREGDRQIVFRGLPIATPDNTEFVEDFNELRFSTYEFSRTKMRYYFERAKEYRPEWVRCYPSSGTMFARFLRSEGLTLPGIKGVLCASEMLFDHQKALLSEVFGARVFSHYGHYEMAVLAGYCEHSDDYHVLPFYGYAELIGPDGDPVVEPGGIGEIVGTSFIMSSTPFIRYRTGDMAVFKSRGCRECGRPYDIWERIEGRREELVVSKKGLPVSMTMLNMHDRTFDGIVEYQFRQSEAGLLCLRYVSQEELTPDAKERLLKGLEAKLGSDFEVRLERVEKLLNTLRGKHRSLVQELDVSGFSTISI